MTATLCSRHPAAALHVGHCAACLIEQALAPAAIEEVSELSGLSVRVPLGTTAVASVFVAETRAGLRRLKRWRVAAPPDFLARFEELTRRLREWNPGAIALPLEAALDAEGRPSVLSEFHQGVPLMDALSAGRVSRGEANSLMDRLGSLLADAHRLGLAHGAVVPGNVLVRATGDPCLLDFGIAPLLAAGEDVATWCARDVGSLAALAAELDTRL